MKFYTIIFTLLFSFTLFGQNVADESEKLKNPFIVNGEVTNIEINEKTYSSDVVLLKIDLKLSAKNISKENVIVLSAFNDCVQFRFVDINDERIAVFNLKTASFLPKRKKIDNQLNKKRPPTKYSKILAPNQIWTFDFQFSEYIPRKIERSRKTEIDENGNTLIIEATNSLYSDVSLEDIEELSPFYLKVVCQPDLVPFDRAYRERENFSYFNMWRDKWKQYGNLWTEEIVSEPILIDIDKAINN